MTHSRIAHPLKYLWNAAEARVVTFCVLAGYGMSNVSLRAADHPLKGRGPGHVIHFRILQSVEFFWNG